MGWKISRDTLTILCYLVFMLRLDHTNVTRSALITSKGFAIWSVMVGTHTNKKVCDLETIAISHHTDFPIQFHLMLKAKAKHLHIFFAFILIKHISNEVEVIIKSIAVHAWHVCLPFPTWKSECQAHFHTFTCIRYVPYHTVFIGHDASTHNYKFKLIVSIEFQFHRIIPMSCSLFRSFCIDFELGTSIRMMQHEMKKHKLNCATRNCQEG